MVLGPGFPNIDLSRIMSDERSNRLHSNYMCSGQLPEVVILIVAKQLIAGGLANEATPSANLSGWISTR